jgi:hypothetical protein
MEFFKELSQFLAIAEIYTVVFEGFAKNKIFMATCL